VDPNFFELYKLFWTLLLAWTFSNFLNFKFISSNFTTVGPAQRRAGTYHVLLQLERQFETNNEMCKLYIYELRPWACVGRRSDVKRRRCARVRRWPVSDHWTAICTGHGQCWVRERTVYATLYFWPEYDHCRAISAIFGQRWVRIRRLYSVHSSPLLTSLWPLPGNMHGSWSVLGQGAYTVRYPLFLTRIWPLSCNKRGLWSTMGQNT